MMRIVALDLVRFFAALSVVLYHYISRQGTEVYPYLSHLTKYGYLGVPLFFIVSGYVIAFSANNRNALQFGISRFVRLYPALWAGVIFSALALMLFSESRFSISQVLANLTLLNEYLGQDDIDGVYWTLKVELKFYACVFLLLLFGVFQNYKAWLSIWLVITVIHTATNQPFFMGWFISPGYSTFFIAGIALFLIQSKGKDSFNLSVLGVSFIVAGFRVFEQADGFLVNPTFGEKLVSVFVVALIYCFMYLLSTGHFILRDRKFIVALGALTYPLYLIHNMAGKAIIDRYKEFLSEEVLVVLVILLMLLLSWLINIIVEKPLSTPLKNYLMRIFSS